MTRKVQFKVSLWTILIGSLGLLFIRVPPEFKLLNFSSASQNVTLILSTLIKFGISLYIVILITYTPEAYATSLRTKALGMCMLVGRLGSIIVPLYVQFMFVKSVNPLPYIGILGIIALLMIKYLPETSEIGMLDYLEQDPGNKSKTSNVTSSLDEGENNFITEMPELNANYFPEKLV